MSERVNRAAMSEKLAVVLNELSEEASAVVEEHLLGGCSAEWLAEQLTDTGYPVSASTIRTQRRAWRREGVVK